MSGAVSRDQDISTVTTFTLDGGNNRLHEAPTRSQLLLIPSDNKVKPSLKNKKQSTEKKTKIKGERKSKYSKEPANEKPQINLKPSPFLKSPHSLKHSINESQRSPRLNKINQLDKRGKDKKKKIKRQPKRHSKVSKKDDYFSVTGDPCTPRGQAKVNLVRWKAKGYRAPITAEGKGERGDGASSIIVGGSRRIDVSLNPNDFDSEEVPPYHSSLSKRTEEVSPSYKAVDKQVSFADDKNGGLKGFHPSRDTATGSEEQRRLIAQFRGFSFEPSKEYKKALAHRGNYKGGANGNNQNKIVGDLTVNSSQKKNDKRSCSKYC